jgi:hypothetical protein
MVSRQDCSPYVGLRTNEGSMRQRINRVNEVVGYVIITREVGMLLPKVNSLRKVLYVEAQCLRCGNGLRGQYKHFKDGSKVCKCSDRRYVIKIKDQRWPRLLSIWHGMKTRCYKTNSTCYEKYGKKGIGICQEWLQDFNVFYEWAIMNGYEDSLTIDRLDSSKSYGPDNCRWSSLVEQSRNRAGVLNISQVKKIKGLLKKRVKCSEIAAIFNIPVKRVYCIKSGRTWSDVT